MADRGTGSRGWCLILRGPLGVGKSTLAAALGASVPAHVISIDRILESEDLEEWEAERIALRSFLRANDCAVTEARSHLSQGRAAIVEGNFYWEEQIEDLVRRVRCPALVVRLHAPVEVCIARDARRPPPDPRVGPKAGERLGEEAVRAVYELVRPSPREQTLEATGTVSDVALALRRCLDAWLESSRGK